MFGKKTKNQRVYLDWAAATPLLPEAKAAMVPYLSDSYGNPSAIHQEGMIARRGVELAREQLARAVQVRPEYVTFTAGGTEANNLAILGVVKKMEAVGRPYSEMEVITTRIEHPSVLSTVEELSRLGVVIKFVSVDETGKVILSELRKSLSEKTVLVTIAYANSEIGTVQPLHSIKKAIKETEQKFSTTVYLHVDAAQAPLWLQCQFDAVGADFMTLDTAKCCGPKGVGILIRSHRAEITAVTFGGGQESGLRPGTENVAGIVGAGVAIEWAQAGWRERAELVCAVRDQAIEYIQTKIPAATLNGATGEGRIANNINISVPGLDTEFTSVILDKEGFAVSTKSACSGAGGGESVVVKEITNDPARATSTLRITLGPDTKTEDLEILTEVLKKHIDKMSEIL
tara:strand:+ start:7037 stop:8239 length:1203 start_codon:yes stop_codon:yes gene_type:complete